MTGTRRSITCHQDSGKRTCVSLPSCSFLKQDPSVSSTGPGFTPEGPDMDPSKEKEVVEEERRGKKSNGWEWRVEEGNRGGEGNSGLGEENSVRGEENTVRGEENSEWGADIRK